MSIVLPNGRVYSPTGDEWLRVFAAADCEWAIEAMKEATYRCPNCGHTFQTDKVDAAGVCPACKSGETAQSKSGAYFE